VNPRLRRGVVRPAAGAAGPDHFFIFESEIAGRGAAWCDLAADPDHFFIFENEIAGPATIRRRAAPARVYTARTVAGEPYGSFLKKGGRWGSTR
jgi:hypothetical protein